MPTAARSLEAGRKQAANLERVRELMTSVWRRAGNFLWNQEGNDLSVSMMIAARATVLHSSWLVGMTRAVPT